MLRTILLISVLSAIGCSDNATSPTSTSLEGTWRILSIQRPSQAVETAPVGVLYQISFEDERVLARVDCNTCTGPYTVSGSTLRIGPTLACTRAACGTASYESAVVSLMGGEHQMTSTLHNLTLSSSRGTVLLQR